MQTYDEGVACITEHPGFKSNCLDKYVLLTTRYEYIQADGPIGDDIHPNEYIKHILFKVSNSSIYSQCLLSLQDL